MAKEITKKEKNNEKETVKKADVQNLEQNQKNTGKKGLPLGLLATVTAIAVIAGIIFGASYFAVRNNIGGITDKYKNNIKSIPILNMALPKVADPDDPKNLTDKEIRQKYTDIKNKRDELSKKVDELNTEIEQLSKSKTDDGKVKAEADKVKKEAADKVAQVEKDKEQLSKDKESFDQAVAAADTKSFKEYYEKFDSETAKKIYSDTVTKENNDQQAKNFAKVYESMDPEAAGKIFEQMGEKKMNLIVETLKNMKKESSSQILAAMSSSFAAKVTDKLREAYKN